MTLQFLLGAQSSPTPPPKRNQQSKVRCQRHGTDLEDVVPLRATWYQTFSGAGKTFEQTLLVHRERL